MNKETSSKALLDYFNTQYMQFINPRKQIPDLSQIHTVSKNKTCLHLVLHVNSFLLYIVLSSTICDEYLRLMISGSPKFTWRGGLTLNGLYIAEFQLGFSVFSSIKKKKKKL